MRSYPMTKIDVADDLPRWQIDDEHLVSIDTWLSDAGAAIDRDKGSASIRGDGNFMTMNSGGLLCYGRDLSRRHRIYDAQIAVALVDYQQRLSTDARWDQSKTKSWEQ